MEKAVCKELMNGFGALMKAMRMVEGEGRVEIPFPGGSVEVTKDAVIVRRRKKGKCWHMDDDPFNEGEEGVIIHRNMVEKVFEALSQLAPWPKTKE
jgi:hypothetical protein